MKRSATTTAPLPTEGGPQTLSAYIQARFDEFSRSQKDVAQYIVDHLDEVAFQTAEELARRANTSSSTVVRFSQALGFEGFPELQGSAREEYRRRVAAGRRRRRRRRPRRSSRSTRATFETALAADHVNVEETARKVSRSDVEAAIDAIAAARRVLHRRHRPDGVLRLLPAPPADAARPPRRGRRPARRRRRSAAWAASTTRRSSSACRPAARTRSSCAR